MFVIETISEMLAGVFRVRIEARKFAKYHFTRARFLKLIPRGSACLRTNIDPSRARAR